MSAEQVHSLLFSGAPGLPAIVAAHPDDEIIGAGAQLRRWPKAHILYVTDGSPPHPADALNAGFSRQEDYALARQREAVAALALVGIPMQQIRELGFPDQKTAFKLPLLIDVLAHTFSELQPSFVLTHAYEGGHPDHDSAAFAVQVACERLARQKGAAPPVIEMAGYFNRGGRMTTGEFLSADTDRVLTIELSAPDRELKQRLFACHKSQHRVLQHFSTSVERFRAAPRYDFTRPPHNGRLFYELFDWGITGERWRQLAREALEKNKRTGRDRPAWSPGPERLANRPCA